MRHIHTSIASRHLATNGNRKILRTTPLHVSSSEERLPRLTRSTLAQLQNKQISLPQISLPQISLPQISLLKSYLHKVDAKIHPSPLCPSVTSTHTTHIISSTAPTYTPHFPPGFVDRPRRSDCIAGQMDGEAGWWTTNGNIGLPPTSKGHGSG